MLILKEKNIVVAASAKIEGHHKPPGAVASTDESNKRHLFIHLSDCGGRRTSEAISLRSWKASYGC